MKTRPLVRIKTDPHPSFAEPCSPIADDGLQMVAGCLLWMDKILHYLRNAGMMFLFFFVCFF